MKRMLILAVAALALAGCAEIRELANRDENPYEKAPFYAKYLNTGSALDAEIQRVLNELRANPDSAKLHNDLGVMLVEKGFPKDAARELERAVAADRHYYPAWYNLGLVRAANGDDLGARHAFIKTVFLKPGHSAALFQLGLIEEKRQHSDRAIALYAKAYSINPALLEVEVNPRILDSHLTDMALLAMYKTKHSRESMHFQDAPSFSMVIPTPPAPPTPSAPATPREIQVPPSPNPPQTVITPAPPADPGAPTSRRRRPRNQATEQPPPQNPPG